MTNSQVFYRKWRPTRFDEVAGQQHVTNTLKRAITTDHVSHAYLFTGPRGVGKTSTARILAKALNSEITPDGEPVTDSEVSIAIDEGRYMDLIEIDGASNRGINDIRDLRDNVQFLPADGKYKVYIIDEVHMLTSAAFNALLKTLEEPPPRIVMILATTEASALPATIISRCQRFDFKRLSNDDVIERLIEVCEAEEIEAEPAVLEMIARTAWGSLRDAENLLEQLFVSYGQADEDGVPSEITESQARELLGLGDTATATELATALLGKDAAAALTVINREAQRGADLRALRSGAVDALRVALLMKAGVEDSITQGSEFAETMSAAARPARLNTILHILTALGQADMKANSSSPLPLELAVLKATTKPVAAVAASTAPASSGAAPARPAAAPQAQQASEPDRPEDAPPAPRKDLSPAEAKWDKVMWAMRRTKNRKYVVGPILRNVEVPEPEGGKISLRFKSNALKKNFMEEMGDKRSREALKTAITDAYGSELELEVRSPHEVAEDEAKANGGNGGSQPTSTAQESAMVRAAMAMGAKVVVEDAADGDSQD
ncbi:MAG: DNA polymerase III subunit gamma/tau [Chloroflexi bacterium]|nr:DNA polymerase III subunit gamma/tau [Chloroflexota bacterium]MBT5628479.1 DNA polymerase III subunit gamma/tau [Chloroflexota bacterium]